jgi:hypothetical protein
MAKKDESVPDNSGESNEPKTDQGSTTPIDPTKSPQDYAKSALGGAAKDAAAQAVPGGEKAVETAQKLQKAVKTGQNVVSGIQSSFSAIMSTIVNPIFWIVVGVIAALILTIMTAVATVQVVGKNENAEGCIDASGSGGGSGVQAVASPDEIATSNSVAGWMLSTNFAFLGNKPLTLNQAAGIIGNWSQESKMIPGAVQPVVAPSSMSNAQLKALGSVSGRAAGLAQWDGARRLQLVKFAESKSGVWSDINIQLEFLKHEFNGWEGSNLISKGFNDQSKSVEDLTEVFLVAFERAGKPHMENRHAAAKNFLENYNGGYSSSTGGSCLMASGGGVNTSDAVQLAISMSYENTAQSRVTPGDSYGTNLAKPEYKEAKKKAEAVGGKDPMSTLYASCDRFVASVTKLTMDKDIPWGSTIQQGQYLQSSPKWQQYTKKSEAQPGDIWVTKTRGHIIMYIGDYKGKDSIAHASYLHRVAAIDSSTYLNESLVDTGGRAYYGYRFIG